MHLFGIAGYEAHGKSTVGKVLRDQAEAGKSLDLEYSDPIIDVANRWISYWPALTKIHTAAEPHELFNTALELLQPALQPYWQDPLDLSRLRHYPGAGETNEQAEHFFKYLEVVNLKNPIVIDRDNKPQHREILLCLGNLKHKLPADFWSLIVERMMEEASSGYEVVLVGGIRSQTEADIIQRRRGRVIRVRNPRKQVPKHASTRASARFSRTLTS